MLVCFDEYLGRMKFNEKSINGAVPLRPWNLIFATGLDTNVTTNVRSLYNTCFLRDDNKEVSLGTSKINYMDPRISVAWCKRCEVPIEKAFIIIYINIFQCFNSRKL